MEPARAAPIRAKPHPVRYGPARPLRQHARPLPREGTSDAERPRSAILTPVQVADLSHFIHERVYDTLRGSPIFQTQNILTGNAKAGAAWFNGAGKCSTCHSATGDLKGIGGRYDPATLLGRFLFPGAAAAADAVARRRAPGGKQLTLTITPPPDRP